ncbi:hypothetical protein O181_017678 [Austropuccinia psidii MF-1]|uniref:Integrase catalytic domain-containing protein n=1 Tax=Austropuccinia psidii MF-1 TaxID=1389203 RepID=A0A9Q3C6I9_9BASI|nr:hypothetical protein [Austropuccinia psidii MF-1]
MVQHVIRINKSIEAIESQFGTLDSSKIITLSLFFSLPDLQENITSALNTCLAANPDITINAEDILDIVKQMWEKNTPAISEDIMHLSRIDASTLQARNNQPSFMPNRNPFPNQANMAEAGNWEPKCPAHLKAANAILSSSQRKAMVASIGAIPMLENEEALLDSGATHTVIGDISLFTPMTKSNKNLLVASSYQLPVYAIGNVTLVTLQGRLPLLPIALDAISDIPPPINLFTCPRVFTIYNINIFCHHCLGHFSIRNSKQLLQFKAADGIPNLPSDNIKIFHPCSIVKAENHPYMSPSQEHINQPGYMIDADLIGPIPTSIDNKKYALIIQDLFSRLTAVIPLNDKSEAKQQLWLWMIRFLNATNSKIWEIRTDNGAEFYNHIFNDFLKEKGIIHKLLITYEHHQNGQIERKNRTILIMANLPTMLFPYVFKHAVWIFNRTLHTNKEMTPYEIFGSR